MPWARRSARHRGPLRPPSDVEATYRRYARSRRKRRQWAADNPGNVAIREELLRGVLELSREFLDGEADLLDIGCGGGWVLEQLRRNGVAPARIHGVDLIETRVEAASRRLPEADVRLADARELPWPDAKFKLVLLLTCLSSMPDEDASRRALGEARRVLSDGGLLLCYEPRIGNPFNRATRRVPRSALRRALGREVASRRITAFPPLSRRLGPLTRPVYPALARIAPTHRLSAYRRRAD